MEHEISCFRSGKILNADQLDENFSWNDTAETLTSELAEAGAAQDKARAAACYLLSAYIHKVPLLLAGPSGKYVADAMSAALFGTTAAEIDASAQYNSQAFQKAEVCDEKIIHVSNFFAGNWILPLIENLQMTNKYYIFSHPFIEDLLIEPHSLFHTVLPVFTDAFIENPADGAFVGGKMMKSYDGLPENQSAARIALPDEFHLSPYADKAYRKVLSGAHTLLEEESADLDYLYGYLPLGYVSGRIEWVKEQAQDEKKITASARKIIQNI